MEISSSDNIGTIECNVPVTISKNADLVEGSNLLTRLLPAGYENKRYSRPIVFGKREKIHV